MKLLRFALPLILIAMMVVGLAPMSAQDDAITIDFWHGLTGPDGAFLEEMVNTYNETNEDGIFVQLNVYHWDIFFDSWVSSVAAGDPPDVVIYHINEMPQYAEAGVVTPIDDLAEEVGVDMSVFPEAVQELSHWNDLLYGVPLDVHPIAMYYNVDYVEAAGLDPESPPTNQEEFLAWAEALTVDEDGDGEIDVYGVSMPVTNVMTFRVWWGWLFQNGATFMNEDQTEVTVNSPEAAETLQFAYDLVYEYGVAPEGQSDPDTDFQTGKVAMTFQGPWWINGFVETEGLNFMTAPQPVIFDEPGVWASDHFFGISVQEDTEGQLAGMKFAKWMVDNGAMWGLSGQIPASTVALESEEFTGSDIYKYQEAFVAELDYIHLTNTIPQSTEIFAENVQTPLVMNYQAVMLDALSVEEALEAMQDGINEVLQAE